MSDLPAWIGVDWGTSNVRAWVVDDQDRVVAAERSDKGMGTLSPDQFEPALLELIGAYLHQERCVPVICCGMVGARQGWVEAPYVQVPCAPPGMAQSISVNTADPRIAVSILPGVCQTSPPDVMRGEETQIAGYLLENPDFDGVICMPGTHSKWVHVSAGEIVSFATYMTGELFALLSRSSVLRHSVGGDHWDDAAFAEAVADAMSRPQGFAARLFTLRADGLLNGDDMGARARLSGLLMGMELAAARPYWLGQNVVIIGARDLADTYANALRAQGVQPMLSNGDSTVFQGLCAAYRSRHRASH